MAGMSEAAKYHAMRRRIKRKIKVCQQMYAHFAKEGGQVRSALSYLNDDPRRATRLLGICAQHATLDHLLHTEPE